MREKYKVRERYGKTCFDEDIKSIKEKYPEWGKIMMSEKTNLQNNLKSIDNLAERKRMVQDISICINAMEKDRDDIDNKRSKYTKLLKELFLAVYNIDLTMDDIYDLDDDRDTYFKLFHMLSKYYIKNNIG